MIIKKIAGRLILLLLPISICNQKAFSNDNYAVRRATIRPSIITLETGQTTKFEIIINSAVWRPTVLSTAVFAEQVKWSVNGVPGGNSEFGTIDRNGYYIAPRKIPSPHEIHITGEIDGVQNQKLFATVIMDPNEPFYESVYQYSEPREESAYFEDPHGVAMDRAGNLVIADERKGHVVRFSREGEFLGYIGVGPGEEIGEFKRPRVVLHDETDGDLYVSDQKVYGNRIQIFTGEGKLKSAFGPKGDEPGKFLRIHGMDFDEDGNLYVVDVDNARVTKMSHEGEYIKSWGQKGIYGNELNEPHGLVVDPNNDVFVSSYYGTIKKFDGDGEYLFSFAEADPANGAVYIHAISDDKWGNIYAMVRGMGGFGGQFENSGDDVYSIKKYNNNGDFVCGIKLSVGAHSENWAVVDDEDGYIYVLYTDANAAGFEVFAPK